MSFQQATACWTGRHNWFEPSTQGMHAAHRRPSEPMVHVDDSLSIIWELRACQRSVPPRCVRQQTIGCFGIRSSAPHDNYIGAPMAPSGAFRRFLITPARTRANAHTPTHMHMLQMFLARKHTHKRTRTRTHTHTHTHTHIHTRTPSRPPTSKVLLALARPRVRDAPSSTQIPCPPPPVCVLCVCSVV
jgi:hypothetical protein